MVAGELLDERTSVTYTAEQRYNGKLPCPVVGCLGVLKDGWNMRRHFRPSFSGQSDRQEGGAELPTMFVLWDANGPDGPQALEDGELLN